MIQRPGGPLEPAPEGTRALAGAVLGGAIVIDSSLPRLIVLSGAAAGERLVIRDGAVLGRGPAAELRLADPLASRRHARFHVGAGRTCVEDLESKNGLALNGRPIRRSRIALRGGDALTLGESVLVFEEGCATEAAGPPATAHEASPPGSGAQRAGPERAVAWVISGVLLSLAALLLLAAA